MRLPFEYQPGSTEFEAWADSQPSHTGPIRTLWREGWEAALAQQAQPEIPQDEKDRRAAFIAELYENAPSSVPEMPTREQFMAQADAQGSGLERNAFIAGVDAVLALFPAPVERESVRERPWCEGPPNAD